MEADTSRSSGTQDPPWLVGFAELEKAVANSRRQTDYVRDAGTRLNADRRRRREKLIDRRAAISKASKALSDLDNGDLPYVVLRSEFVARRNPRTWPPEDRRREEIRTRPDNTKLLHERNPHAHGLVLGGLLVNQMDAARADYDPARTSELVRQNVFNSRDAASWVTLTGLEGGHPRERRRRLNRAIQALFNCDLVGLGEGAHPYRGFKFNCEDGSGKPYKMPAESNRSELLCLPVQFFTSAWHLVLPPPHLATFLAIARQADWLHYHRSQESAAGVYLADQLRWSYLGLSDEAYETIHELEEFGLIDVIDPMPNRQRGRLKPSDQGLPGGANKRVCYQLKEKVFGGRPSSDAMYNSELLSRPAIEVLIEQLGKPTPRYS
jgi:hypothetical protein